MTIAAIAGVVDMVDVALAMQWSSSSTWPLSATKGVVTLNVGRSGARVIPRRPLAAGKADAERPFVAGAFRVAVTLARRFPDLKPVIASEDVREGPASLPQRRDAVLKGR